MSTSSLYIIVANKYFIYHILTFILIDKTHTIKQTFTKGMITFSKFCQTSQAFKILESSTNHSNKNFKSADLPNLFSFFPYTLYHLVEGLWLSSKLNVSHKFHFLINHHKWISFLANNFLNSYLYNEQLVSVSLSNSIW